MISWIISMMSGLFQPALLDPAVIHHGRLEQVVAQLNSADQELINIEAGEGLEEYFLRVKENSSISRGALPPISGRLLENDAIEELAKALKDRLGMDEEFFLGEPDLSSLKVVGIIEADSSRVALLDDGVDQKLVGTGSYVLGNLRVVNVGKSKIVLIYAGQTGGLTKTYDIYLESN